MSRQSRRSSIKQKLFIPIALLVLSIVVFQVLYFPSTLHDKEADALEVKAMTVSRLISHAIGPAFDMADDETIKKRFSGASGDEDLLFVAVYDEESSLIVQHKIDETAMFQGGFSTAQSTRIRDEVMHIVFPFETKNGTPGTLVLGFSMERINSSHRSSLFLSLMIGGIILLASFIVAYLVGLSWAKRVRTMAIVAENVARGNLDCELLRDESDDELGRLSDAFDSMLTNQRELVSEIVVTAIHIGSSADQIMAASQRQRQGSTEQSSAVEETRRIMENLLSSSRDIAETSSGVLKNAELTYENNQQIAESIRTLSIHTKRISEILEVIKGIASKTDLLALNAALEGTKAGEAGQGFSLVAGQMQRLADNVMRSADDIKNLTGDMRESTTESVMAAEEATKIAADTTQSARRINLIVQQQQSGTEQVSLALDDIHDVARQSVEGSRQAVDATQELVALASKLRALVLRFRLKSAPRHSPYSHPGPLLPMTGSLEPNPTFVGT